MNACSFVLLTVLGFAHGETTIFQTMLASPKCDDKIIKCIEDHWSNYTGPEPHFMGDFIKAKITHLIGATPGVMPDEVQCAYADNFKDRMIFNHVNKPGASEPRKKLRMTVAECKRGIYYPIIGMNNHFLPPTGDVRGHYVCADDGVTTDNPFGVITDLSPNYLETDYQLLKNWFKGCGIRIKDYPYDCPIQ